MSQELVTVIIDGKEVQVPKGTLLVEAAKKVGIDIPVFCYHPKMDPAGVCRMCLVQVEKMPKPVTACTQTVNDGMVVHTQNEVVADLRKGVLEFLLINHPLDCPVCDKGGECDLQDLTFQYGPSTSRLIDGKVNKPKAVDLGPSIVLDNERCIVCRRCTRFDDEIAAEGNLIIAERGHLNVVTTSHAQPYDSYFSGNTIELCPVGALTSDTYRFRARPWDISSVDSVCNGCAVGCGTREDYRHGVLTRVISQDTPETDGGWLCDRGRFNYNYVNEGVEAPDALDPSAQRVMAPMVRRGGKLVEVSWQEAITEVSRRFKQITAEHGGSAVGLIGGGRLTNEEAYVFQKLGRAGLGTNNVDYRVDGQIVASVAGYNARQTDLDDADFVLIADVLPAERAPVLDLRVRRGLERRGMRLVAVGSALPAYRARHGRIAVRPGDTAAVLAALAAAVRGDKHLPALPDGVAADTIVETAKLLQAAKKPIVLWGGDDAAAGHALTDLLAAARQVCGRTGALVLPLQHNARGAEAMGMLPGYLPGFASVADKAKREPFEKAWRTQISATPGLNTDGMLSAAATGQLQALYIAGANPAVTYRDGALVRAALEKVPFLVVQDMFLTETAQHANVVLPAAPFPSKEGRLTTLDGLVQTIRQSASTPGETQPDLLIFDAIGAALGGNLIKSAPELNWELQHLAGLGPETGTLPPAPAALLASTANTLTTHDSQTDDSSSLLLVAVDRLFAGGGTTAYDRDLEPRRPQAVAAVHPADAAALSLAANDTVSLSGPGGSLELPVALDDNVVRGTVQVVRLLPDAAANRLTAGDGPVRVTVTKRVMEVVGQ